MKQQNTKDEHRCIVCDSILTSDEYEYLAVRCNGCETYAFNLFQSECKPDVVHPALFDRAVYDQIEWMIDSETLALEETGAITSLGVVAFNTATKTILYRKKFSFGMQRALAVPGATFSIDTMRWWHEQPIDIFESEVLTATHTYEEMVEWLSLYIHKDDLVWFNRLDFDLPKMKRLYAALGQPVPWSWYKVCDLPSIIDFLQIRKAVKDARGGDMSHNAEYDCLDQINALWMCADRVGMTEVQAVEPMQVEVSIDPAPYKPLYIPQPMPRGPEQNRDTYAQDKSDDNT